MRWSRLVWHRVSVGLLLIALGWAMSMGSSIHSCHEEINGEHCSAAVEGDCLSSTVEFDQSDSSCPACTMLHQLSSASASSDSVILHVLSDGALTVGSPSTVQRKIENRANGRGPPTI